MKKIDLILENFTPSLLALFIVLLSFFVVKWLLDRQMSNKKDRSLIRAIAYFSIILFGLITIISVLPIDDQPKSLIINFIGIVVSAVLALGSTTFIGNGLAGIMIRTVNTFRPGDFIRINGQFGQITQRRFFHTEIQTEDRNITTLPNLYLVSNPVNVTREDGTFIFGTCSLGYDVNRAKVETALLKAAKDAKLFDPFVRIMELGDYSIVYRVYGMVKKIEWVLREQSALNAKIIDCLHDADIEIVSPSFMNQRRVGDIPIIPEKVKKSEQPAPSVSAEKKQFDVGQEAKSIEKQREELVEMKARIAELKKFANPTDETNQLEITKLEEKYAKLQSKIDEGLDKLDGK